MSIKTEVQFQLRFRGDGSSTTLIADTATAPFAYYIADVSLPLSLPTITPSSVVDLSTSGSFTATASLFLGILTFTFSAAPAAATDYLVYGTLLF